MSLIPATWEAGIEGSQALGEKIETLPKKLKVKRARGKR
jgi:hypothetical protein